MSSKLTRSAFQQLIAEDIVWLEAQPDTLERDHVIMCVRESERYYYDEAQDEAIKAARARGLRPLDPAERMHIRGLLLDVVPSDAAVLVCAVVDQMFQRRREANQP